jgi:UDP-2,4-diacetamido-2,4,6-trideoxy-beta-L-altropyranose hydrolase
MALNKKIIIRADAAPRMGTGHVMRCIALAQAAQKEDFTVHFVSRIHVDWVKERLSQEHLAVHLLESEVPKQEKPEELLAQIALADAGQPSEANKIWVVTDGYHFTPACQKAIMTAGYKLLVIDDYNHLPEYHCDVLLNQNIGAEEFCYKGNIGKKCLGLDYVLLRQEFLEARKKAEQRIFPETPQNILITLGGGNFIDYLEKIAATMTLPELTGRTIKIIQGAMDQERILRAFEHCPARIEILPRVDDMPALLLNTDLCITAGGSTCWELLCLGVPFLTVEVAENQKKGLQELHSAEIAQPYSKKSFLSMLHIRLYEKKFLDMKGVFYVLNEIKITLREVCLDDCDFLFTLANNKNIRSMSFNTNLITYQEHINWFSNIIKNKQFFYIILDRDIQCGYVRFAERNTEVTVSIALMPEFHGQGIGLKALQEACKRISKNTYIQKIHALIKLENTASLLLFHKVGFTRLKNTFYNKKNVAHFVLKCPFTRMKYGLL